MERKEWMIETTINAQTVNCLGEAKLALMLKSGEFDEQYIVQIFNFFTDVPLQDIARFMVWHGITEETLKTYYEFYIQYFYPNPELEEMLADVEGTFPQSASRP